MRLRDVHRSPPETNAGCSPHLRASTRHVLVTASLLLIAIPAAAQSSYVTGALGVDFSHFGHSVTDGEQTKPPAGSTLGGAVRVGTAFGEQWGVEFEFATATAIERHGSTENFAALLSGLPLGVSFLNLGFSFSGPDPSLPVFEIDVTRRNSTFNTLGWVNKQLTDRAHLRVLFGVGLRRTTFDVQLSASRGVVHPNSAQASVYETGAVVGTDVAIRLAERWRFVPSTRLHSLDSSGWLLRTTAGMALTF